VFRKFLAAGLTLVLGVQAILIVAGVLRLFPVTGITLPFMSYGGSSLLANMILVTLLARISHAERT
jgi:cell division protein FtsW (lipid II flippase)